LWRVVDLEGPDQVVVAAVLAGCYIQQIIQ
jgi:hypothetical protein